MRPENGLFFANAAGFREAIIAEMTSSAEPVKAVLLDLGATTDLDVPSADMLAELGEELHSRNVRFMLMRVIMPVRQMLERAGAMEKISPQDIFYWPDEAVVDYLSSNTMMPASRNCCAAEPIQCAPAAGEPCHSPG